MTTTVTDGNGTSHFVEVFDGKRVTGKALVFLPAGVTLAEQVPMLVYFHGYNSQNDLDSYMKAAPARDLRKVLRGKKALLVEPWGGNKSTFGAFTSAAGLATLIEYAMFTAVSYGPPTRPCPVKPPPPASLILAGFSGGGAPLQAAVKAGPPPHLFKQVWCFDCMYSGEGAAWVKWAKANPDKTLRVRATTKESSGKPRAEAKVVEAAGLDAEIVEMSHEDCPATFIPKFL